MQAIIFEYKIEVKTTPQRTTKKIAYHFLEVINYSNSLEFVNRYNALLRTHPNKNIIYTDLINNRECEVKTSPTSKNLGVIDMTFKGWQYAQRKER